MHQLDGFYVVQSVTHSLQRRANGVPDHQLPFRSAGQRLGSVEMETGLAEESHRLVESLQKDH